MKENKSFIKKETNNSKKQKPVNVSNINIVPSNGKPQKIYSTSARPNLSNLEFK